MANVVNLGWGNLSESPVFDGNPLSLDSNIGRMAGVIQYQTTDATPVDVTAFYPPGILTGSAQAVMGTLNVEAIAMKDDNSVCGSWNKGITVQWDAAGAATMVGAVFDNRAEQGASGYAFTFTIGAGGILMRITGAAETVNWVFLWSLLSLDNIP